MGTGVSTLLWPPDLTNTQQHEKFVRQALAVQKLIMNKEKRKGPAATYSPTVNRSTIGVRVLNFRVRDGNGCVHPAVATGSNQHTAARKIRTASLGSPKTDYE